MMSYNCTLTALLCCKVPVKAPNEHTFLCRGAFVQVSHYVEAQFPGTEVLGLEYPVAFHKVCTISYNEVEKGEQQ